MARIFASSRIGTRPSRLSVATSWNPPASAESDNAASNRRFAMTRRHALRLAALAATVSLGSVLAQTGHAQTVRVFEDAPSLEQLRSILIPESKPGGLSRRIELPRRETL